MSIAEAYISAFYLPSFHIPVRTSLLAEQSTIKLTVTMHRAKIKKAAKRNLL